jgi:hypothetical protein
MPELGKALLLSPVKMAFIIMVARSSAPKLTARAEIKLGLSSF